MTDTTTEMRELEPAALMAAYEAHKAHAADPGRKGSGLEKAIRAYLDALSASQPQGDVARLEREAMRLAALAGVVWDEMEDHGSDGENRTTYRRIAARNARRGSLPHSDGAVAKPVAAEQYCLGLLVEEWGEIGQWIGKALRFGMDTPGKLDATGSVSGETPRTLLPAEVGDMLAAIEFTLLHGVLDRAVVEAARDRKLAKLTNPSAVDNLGRPLAPQPPASPINPVPAGVGVKNLEWINEDQRWAEAPSLVGLYRIGVGDDGVYWSLSGKQKSHRCESISAAKAAAQADYETRIRSALLRQAPDAEQGAGK